MNNLQVGSIVKRGVGDIKGVITDITFINSNYLKCEVAFGAISLKDANKIITSGGKCPIIDSMHLKLA